MPMKSTLLPSLALCLAMPCGTKAGTLFDDFNDGVINPSLWSVWLPAVPNRGATESGGYLQLFNGASLITASPFANASVSGRFRISGWDYDRFNVIVRSDGTSVDNHWQERIGGLGIQFTAGSDPDYGSSQTLQLWDLRTGTRLATAAPTINMNTYYDFLVTDSGTEIKVYLNDLVNPALTFSTSTSYGDMIEFHNRTQLLAGPPPYYLDLDFLSITQIPEPTSLFPFGSLTGLAAWGWLRRNRQRRSGNSE